MHGLHRDADAALDAHLKEQDDGLKDSCGECMRLYGVRGGIARAILTLGGRVK